MDLFDNQQLSYNNFFGNFIDDYIQLGADNETIKIYSKIFAIESCEISFKSQFDGYIGLAPYYGRENLNQNFLYQLMSKGKIDNPVFSIFINIERN